MSYTMSTARTLRPSDVKYCILCGKSTIAEEGVVSCCRFEFCESDDGMLKLNGYAEKDMMKCCYACGGPLFIDDDCMYCESCNDTVKFNRPTSVVVSVKEVLHCVLCGKRLKCTGNKPRCAKECAFRLPACDDNDAVTTCLINYATKGIAAHCYVCGSSTTRDADGEYLTCSMNGCSSCRLPLSPLGTQMMTTNGAIKPTHGMWYDVYTVYLRPCEHPRTLYAQCAQVFTVHF